MTMTRATRTSPIKTRGKILAPTVVLVVRLVVREMYERWKVHRQFHPGALRNRRTT